MDSRDPSKNLDGFLHLLAWCAIAALAISRWMTWDVDFPPISGSLGEYADMGYNFAGIRSYELNGIWNLSANPSTLLFPIYNGLVFGALKILGHSFFTYRFISLVFSTCSIATVAAFVHRTCKVEDSRVGKYWPAITAAGLLASDALWFAYARAEKQEVTAATLLLFAATGFGYASLSASKRGFIIGFCAALAFATKLNVLFPIAGMFMCGMLVHRDRRTILGLLSGMLLGVFGVGLIVSLILATPILAEGQTHQFHDMVRFYGDIASAPSGPFAAIENVLLSNIFIRSPLLLLGVCASLLVALRWKDAEPMSAALAGMILACFIAPSLNAYFPLRYRILPIPAAALLVTCTVFRDGSWRSRSALTVIAGAAGFAGSAFAATRLHLFWPWISLIVSAVMALAVYAFFPIIRRAAKTSIAIVLAIPILVGILQITSWQRTARYDLREISEHVDGVLKRRARVATNSWWGQMILLNTEFTEVPLNSGCAEAYLLTREADGSWSKGETPRVEFSLLQKIYERRAWYGAEYELYIPRSAVK